MRAFKSVLKVAAIGLLLLLTYPGLTAASALAALRQLPDTTATGGSPAWIHVAHPSAAAPYLADESGRTVILRGVVVAGLVDYWTGTDPAQTAPPPHFPIDPAAYADGRCPTNDATSTYPPVCAEDITQIRALGFDVIRLALSWSLLEPQPGQYDTTYLARIHQVVEWARAAGLRVILDFHQNAYSRYVGRADPAPLPMGESPGLNDYDGAPAWATFPDWLPSEKFVRQREINPAVFEAATSFWLNRDGIQDRYIAAVARLARDYRDDSTVLGYSPYNEPWPGWIGPPTFEDTLLFPFYRRVIDAVTGIRDGIPCPAGIPYPPTCTAPDLGVHDRNHVFFLEPGLLRSVTDFPTHLSLAVSAYPNVALSLHTYAHIYTLETFVKVLPADWPPYDQTFRWGAAEARAMGAALFVSEFGNNPSNDSAQLAAQLAQQDAFQVGSTFWTWKQNCGGPPWGVYEGVYPDGAADCAYDQKQAKDTAPKPQNGILRPVRVMLLQRGVPVAVPAGPFAFANDDATGAFTMSGTARAGGELVLRLPARAGEPEISGGRLISSAGDDVRILRIALAGGAYTIRSVGR